VVPVLFGMRFVNADGRAGLLVGDSVFDVEDASSGRLPADPMEVLARYWDDVVRLCETGAFAGGVPVAQVRLGPPVPRPPMIASVIANFPPSERPLFPMVVGKSPSAIVGPFDDIVLPDPALLPLKRSWVVPEPELGIVMRGGGRHLDLPRALDAVAGFVVAQDVTERAHEFGPASSPWTWENLPAKTLGKSIDTFCPIGPALVTLDELPDPDCLVKRCWINEELRFEQSTADMLWSAAELVALLSAFMTLTPGLLCLSGRWGDY
jgi:2,4-didehydro-3-deoxy-L-rhamnonate hydrolase